MFDNKERELKILLDREQFDKLLHTYTFGNPFVQKNTYYDTPTGYIRSKGGALRIREVQGKHVLTLKLPSDSITKFEYEEEVHTSNIHQLTPQEWSMVADRLPELKEEDLQPLTYTETTRRIDYLPDAELCLDETRFPHGTDYELEYEFTRDHDGIAAFNQILAPVGLHFTSNCPSKLARALAGK